MNELVMGAVPLRVGRRVMLNVGEPRQISLTLVGCGGTGSFLALHLARLAWHAREQGIEIKMAFVDPDVVEAKNVGRQNFCPAEVGAYKAEALARRYALAFGIPIWYHNEALGPKHVDQQGRYQDGWLHLVIGAVDNTPARADIRDVCAGWRRRLWWLDCGNHDMSGQVVLGNRWDIEEEDLNPLGFAVGLPLPSVRHPELVEPPSGSPLIGGRVGACAEDVLAGAQSLMVNQMVAGWAASYVYRLAVGRDLDCWGTYFDLRAGSARSEYIGESDQGVSVEVDKGMV